MLCDALMQQYDLVEFMLKTLLSIAFSEFLF
jgi:hypothetical protein